MLTAGPNGQGKPEKKLYADSIDADAARRQAVNSLSNAMMSLQFIRIAAELPEDMRDAFDAAFEDLTKARYLLVEVCDPDNVLDELSQL